MIEIATSVHIIGVGGAGMSGLAKLLAQLGHSVTGSDLRRGPAFDSLSDTGIEVWEGSDPARMRTAELVVASSAVPEHDLEWVTAGDLGIERWRRPQLLDALTSSMKTIGATGTHGKTTSTAMMIACLRVLGVDPSFLVGGMLTDMNTNAHLGNRDLLVIEADEAFGTFQSLHLSGLTVTNVEEEHLDYYETLYRLEDAFVEVVRNTNGPVTVNLDDPGGRRLAERTGATTYGLSESADWVISDVVEAPNGTGFFLKSTSWAGTVSVALPGLHNVFNAAGVLSVLGEVGFDVGRAAEALSVFQEPAEGSNIAGRWPGHDHRQLCAPSHRGGGRSAGRPPGRMEEHLGGIPTAPVFTNRSFFARVRDGTLRGGSGGGDRHLCRPRNADAWYYRSTGRRCGDRLDGRRGRIRCPSSEPGRPPGRSGGIRRPGSDHGSGRRYNSPG